MAEAQKTHILLTGGTDGIGKAAALELARQDVQLILMARNPAKAQATLAAIQAQTGKTDVVVLPGDLASLDSVRAFAANYRERFGRLDVLLNHGGGYFIERGLSPDGYELTFATNYLGPTALTLELLDLLTAQTTPRLARIVNTASFGVHLGRMRFDDLQWTRGPYRSMQVYAQSKRANLMFTFALARRLAQQGVTVNAFHPGLVRTNIEGNRELGPLRLLTAIVGLRPQRPGHMLAALARSPRYAGITGRYYTNGRQMQASRAARDLNQQERLWRITEELLQTHGMRIMG